MKMNRVIRALLAERKLFTLLKDGDEIPKELIADIRKSCPTWFVHNPRPLARRASPGLRELNTFDQLPTGNQYPKLFPYEDGSLTHIFKVSSQEEIDKLFPGSQLHWD